jgi:ring-1,2-phenylacetyl-CoA epoxidase subunit PaaD
VVTAAELRAVVAAVPDPEIPVLTIDDLGILRDVVVEEDRVRVVITPTYSGCPAMDAIRSDITNALALHGLADVEVETVLSPAWSTAWMSEAGRQKLAAYGIAPPRSDRAVDVRLGGLTCPQCGSRDTEELSRFAATACQSSWRCRACREPFPHFKDH